MSGIKMTLTRSIVELLLVVLGLAVCVLVFQALRKGGATESADARELIESLRTDLPSLMSEKDRVFFDTEKNFISVDIYGVLDARDQEAVADVIRARARRSKFRETIEIDFFPVRIMEKRVNGDRTESTLKQAAPLRRIRLMPQAD